MPLSSSHRNALTFALLAAAPLPAPAAAAQTSVTLYGLIDMGLLYDNDNHQSRLNVDSGLSGQSRWGLRGTETLGNGFSATFQFEGGLSADTGSSMQGRLFGRQATVGLAGPFGQLQLGRQVVLGYSWTPAVASPFGVSWSRNSIGTTFGYRQGDFGTDGRISNSVIYTTPEVSGWQAAAGYSFSPDNEQFRTADNDRIFTGGLRYTQGPLALAATLEMLNTSNAGPGNRREARNLQVAASYDFEVVKLHAGYNEQRDINVSPAPGYIASGGHRDRAYTVGASAPVGAAGRIMASYQNAVLSKVSGYGLAYKYTLSKRTSLYVLFNDTDTRDHVRDKDIPRRQLGAGIQHLF